MTRSTDESMRGGATDLILPPWSLDLLLHAKLRVRPLLARVTTAPVGAGGIVLAAQGRRLQPAARRGCSGPSRGTRCVGRRRGGPRTITVVATGGQVRAVMGHDMWPIADGGNSQWSRGWWGGNISAAPPPGVGLTRLPRPAVATDATAAPHLTVPTSSPPASRPPSAGLRGARRRPADFRLTSPAARSSTSGRGAVADTWTRSYRLRCPPASGRCRPLLGGGERLFDSARRGGPEGRSRLRGVRHRRSGANSRSAVAYLNRAKLGLSYADASAGFGRVPPGRKARWRIL